MAAPQLFAWVEGSELEEKHTSRELSESGSLPTTSCTHFPHKHCIRVLEQHGQRRQPAQR